jgi:hypothetical protein
MHNVVAMAETLMQRCENGKKEEAEVLARGFHSSSSASSVPTAIDPSTRIDAGECQSRWTGPNKTLISFLQTRSFLM